MGMRRVLIVSTALALVTLVGSGSAAGGSRCPATGKTVLRTAEARIWTVKAMPADRHYGCAYSVGRVVRLDPRRGELTGTDTVVLAGTATAFATGSFELKPYRVVVRSLRTGAVVHSAPANAQRSSDGHTDPVLRIVLRRNGAAAWTASVDCVCEGVDYSENGFEVHAIGSDDRHHLLDRGRRVDPDSLSFVSRRTKISWTSGGATRTAALR